MTARSPASLWKPRELARLDSHGCSPRAPRPGELLGKLRLKDRGPRSHQVVAARPRPTRLLQDPPAHSTEGRGWEGRAQSRHGRQASPRARRPAGPAAAPRPSISASASSPPSRARGSRPPRPRHVRPRARLRPPLPRLRPAPAPAFPRPQSCLPGPRCGPPPAARHPHLLPSRPPGPRLAVHLVPPQAEAALAGGGGGAGGRPRGGASASHVSAPRRRQAGVDGGRGRLAGGWGRGAARSSSSRARPWSWLSREELQPPGWPCVSTPDIAPGVWRAERMNE